MTFRPKLVYSFFNKLHTWNIPVVLQTSLLVMNDKLHLQSKSSIVNMDHPVYKHGIVKIFYMNKFVNSILKQDFLNSFNVNRFKICQIYTKINKLYNKLVHMSCATTINVNLPLSFIQLLQAVLWLLFTNKFSLVL